MRHLFNLQNPSLLNVETLAVDGDAGGKKAPEWVNVMPEPVNGEIHSRDGRVLHIDDMSKLAARSNKALKKQKGGGLVDRDHETYGGFFMPGGGTTDYAIAIFHAALRGDIYQCYLAPDTTLPMIYMPDAIRATLELMAAPAASIAVRSAYNVSGLSFSPRELAAAIRRAVPGFEIVYQPDGRQNIAATWPQSLDDRCAAADWGWKTRIGLDQLVADMLANVGVGMTEAA